MNGSYSILIIPWRGTRIQRLVVSRRSIRLLACTLITLLALGGWHLNNYYRMKLERAKGDFLRTQLSEEVTTLSTRLKEEVAELRAKHNEEMTRLRTQVEVQRENLMALQKRTKTSQLLLAKWKGLRKKIRDSLPRKRKSLLTGQQIVWELGTSLSLLRRDLEGLIASIPSEWPTKGWLSSRFGRRRSPWTKKMEFHNGLDIANRRGTPVYASGNGVVKFAGQSNGSGKSVVINHGQGITTLYGHLSKIHVKKGERVKKNQKIANVGSTGKSTNPHLHYEVRISGTPIDPRRHLLKQKTPSS